MKRGRPHEVEDLEEKRISSEFAVFVAEGEALGNIRTLVELNEASHLIFDISFIYSYKHSNSYDRAQELMCCLNMPPSRPVQLVCV